MSFEEKLTWVNAVVSVVVTAVYCALVFGQVGDVPVADVAYQWPMVISIVALIILTIIGGDRHGDRDGCLCRDHGDRLGRRHRPEGRAGRQYRSARRSSRATTSAP